MLFYQSEIFWFCREIDQELEMKRNVIFWKYKSIIYMLNDCNKTFHLSPKTYHLLSVLFLRVENDLESDTNFFLLCTKD